MIRCVYKAPNTEFEWIDVVYPSNQDLHDAATRYGLHPGLVEDTLDARHLPKLERTNGNSFVLLRCYDERLQDVDCATVQELTRKIAIFITGNRVITIHRADMAWLTQFIQRWDADPEGTEDPYILLLALTKAALNTFGVELNRADQVMDSYEFVVFKELRTPIDFTQFYFMKRRMALIRRLVRMTGDVVTRLEPIVRSEHATQVQDLKETVESLFFQADELMQDGQQLMQTYMSIASNNNNDVVRVLTLFSAFFLPLTFIVGLYGMNFKYMPELDKEWGYPTVIIAMIVVAAGIYWWFRRNKWL